jgi:serine protease Do
VKIREPFLSMASTALVLPTFIAGMTSCTSKGAASPAPQVTSPAAPAALDSKVTARTETPGVAKSLSKAFAATASAVRPSVVRIDAQISGPAFAPWARRPGMVPGQPSPVFRRFDLQQAPDFPGVPTPAPIGRTGSGFVIDAAGDIVTNSHVVDGSVTLKVTLADGREVAAKLVGRDSRTDVAVLRLAPAPREIITARLGNSDQIEVGEWVLAIGSPLGLEQTVTAGIVSGKGHVGKAIRMSGDRVREYIQTDAKINPGNSGGPLVDLDGEVIGINTLIKMGAGGAYGFAVPINEVRRVAEDLIRDGRIHYPFLGVSVRDLLSGGVAGAGRLEDVGSSPGAYVVDVRPDGPAAKAGLRPGDVIVKLDGEDVRVSSDVVDNIAKRSIGAHIALTVRRDGRTERLEATLAETPGGRPQVAATARLGLSLQSLTPGLSDSLGLPPGVEGPAVTDVAVGSPAERAGLLPGEVILEIDRRRVRSPEEAESMLGVNAPTHLVRVLSRSGVRFVNLRGL